MENIKTNTATAVVEKTRKTVRGILWDKFLSTLEESPLSSIFSTVAKVLLSIVFALSLIDIPLTLSLSKKALYYGDFAIIKILGAILFVFGWRIWWKCSKWILEGIQDGLEHISESIYRPQEVDTVRGVPVAELVDYLFETKGFKIKETIERFAISRGTYDFLAWGFDDTKIFIRGENNARVLNPDFSRSDIVSILSRVDTEGFKQLIRKESENTYTHSPSMPEILERNEADSPTKSHGFTVRRLEAVSAS